MNRQLKTQNMRENILRYSASEFASQGYLAGSLNTICSKADISKGIIYHYFGSKKELYLACLEDCFNRLTIGLKHGLQGMDPVSPEDYFLVRSRYFSENPDEAELFCQAVLYPPRELTADIEEKRAAFDSFNEEVLGQILSGQRLRADLTQEDALILFRQLQDFLNARYHQTIQMDKSETDVSTFDVKKAMQLHEKECLKALSIFLYGIIRR
ncbi:MAG TPA: TetR/AcrR family transcriptional regulator [Lachnospiraceae bacterium]|jgi:AcrR family transcriptional regulator|nr:TetR/AcrR family transcriptional regulator [Lachnospiraceae bacterium]